jgi:TRAP-type mannitol/chloroaromatic compound transport system substrate-binding protein
MDRRTLIQTALVGAAVGTGAGIAAARVATPQAAAGPTQRASRATGNASRRLTMVTSWPKNLPGLGESAERISALVNEISKGDLEIRVYAAGEVVGAFEVFDAVSSGASDMYHSADYYWQGKSSAYPFFTAVPFGLTAQEHMAWIEWGGGQALWNELAAPFNIVPMLGANTMHQMGGWFKKEINTLDDFRGLKMRIPGLGGEVVRALGGAAVAVPGGEIYGALQSGLIDGAEWVGPWNDFFLGFYREAPFYYGPGFHEPGAALAVGINRKVWEGLSAEHQAIIKAACAQSNHMSIGEFTHQNGAYLEILRTQHNVRVKSFPQDLWKRAGEASKDILSKAGSGSTIARKIYEGFQKARKSGDAWADVSDAPYYALRKLGQ